MFASFSEAPQWAARVPAFDIGAYMRATPFDLCLANDHQPQRMRMLFHSWQFLCLAVHSRCFVVFFFCLYVIQIGKHIIMMMSLKNAINQRKKPFLRIWRKQACDACFFCRAVDKHKHTHNVFKLQFMRAGRLNRSNQ